MEESTKSELICESGLVKAMQALCESECLEAVRGLYPDEADELESAYKHGELPQMIRSACAALGQVPPGALEALAQEMLRVSDVLKEAEPDHPASKLSHTEFSERLLETFKAMASLPDKHVVVKAAIQLA